MKRTIFSTAAVFALTAAPSFAGNMSEPVMSQEPVMAAPMVIDNGSNWSGFYSGGSLGYADAGEASDAFDEDGLTYGVHAGYDYDFGSFVLGGELELSGFDVADDANALDSVARAKLRAGYDAGSFLPYVTVGIAQLDIGGLDLDDTGGVYGVGVDYAYSDNIRIGGEILRHEFDDFAGTTLDFDATTAAVRVAFEF